MPIANPLPAHPGARRMRSSTNTTVAMTCCQKLRSTLREKCNASAQCESMRTASRMERPPACTATARCRRGAIAQQFGRNGPSATADAAGHLTGEMHFEALIADVPCDQVGLRGARRMETSIASPMVRLKPGMRRIRRRTAGSSTSSRAALLLQM